MPLVLKYSGIIAFNYIIISYIIIHRLDHQCFNYQAKSQKSLWRLVVIKYPPSFLLFLLTANVMQLAFWMQYSTTPPLILFPAHVTSNRHVIERFLWPRTRRVILCFLASSTMVGPFSFPSTSETSTCTFWHTKGPAVKQRLLSCGQFNQ